MSQVDAVPCPVRGSSVQTVCFARGEVARKSGAVIHLERVSGEAWDKLASSFDDVNQEQTACFSEARWGSDRVEYLVAREAGEIIGGAAVTVLAVPVLSCAVALIKWGPLWRRTGQPANPDHLCGVLAALKEEYAVRRKCYFSVFPHADPGFGQTTLEILGQLGFSESWSHRVPDRYLVNVALTAEELRQGLSQKWRYNLKKSLKHDLQIRCVGGEEGLAHFMPLYANMLQRKGFQDSSAIQTLPALVRSPVADFQPEFVMVYHQGVATAGAVIDTSGDRAVYLYGATDDRALRLKAGFAMHWWIAERLIGRPRLRWYDLGGTDGDSGLHQFKKGFVGKQGLILPTPPSYELAECWQARLAGRTAFLLRDARATLTAGVHTLGACFRS